VPRRKNEASGWAKQLSGVKLGQAVRERRKQRVNETGMTGMRKDEADSMTRH